MNAPILGTETATPGAIEGYPILSRELRNALRTLGLSQVQFARDLEVSDRTVRYWIAGTFRIPAPAVRLIRESLRRGYYRAPKGR